MLSPCIHFDTRQHNSQKSFRRNYIYIPAHMYRYTLRHKILRHIADTQKYDHSQDSSDRSCCSFYRTYYQNMDHSSVHCIQHLNNLYILDICHRTKMHKARDIPCHICLHTSHSCSPPHRRPCPHGICYLDSFYTHFHTEVHMYPYCILKLKYFYKRHVI